MKLANGQWPYYAHLTMVSSNRKTGPIPTSVTNSATCPPACPLKGNGCYPEYGPSALHWRKVDSGERAMPWEMFVDAVDTIAPKQLWRHNVAGDLPGALNVIDRDAMDMLVSSNFGKRGFTYTHYPPKIPDNASAIADANLRGFTVNLSANSVQEADALADLGIGPVVCILPMDATENVKTPKGRTVVVCPATQREGVTCATCQLCYHQRDTIVGFPAHGSGARKVERTVLFATT